jgi:hypothetical protein
MGSSFFFYQYDDDSSISVTVNCIGKVSLDFVP